MPEPGLVGAYVLDALDDVERAGFEGHLRRCERCAHELAELQEAAAELAESVAVVAPAHLRTQVLTQIARTRQVPPPAPSPAPVRPHQRLVAAVRRLVSAV